MKSVRVEGRYRHFVTGDFKSHAEFLSDEMYGRVLDSIVFACVDILVCCKGKMLLGKRAYEPQQGWWVIGGRMMPGEGFEDAAARKVKQEISLDIGPSRFQYLSTSSFVSSVRAQSPKGNGCHMVAITMVLEITDEEIMALEPNKEYKELEWILLQNILSEHSSFYPALVKHAGDLINFLAERNFFTGGEGKKLEP